MYALLNSIQKVKRFEMTLMFMTRKDKQGKNKYIYIYIFFN